jgi:hypothetical protein
MQGSGASLIGGQHQAVWRRTVDLFWPVDWSLFDEVFRATELRPHLTGRDPMVKTLPASETKTRLRETLDVLSDPALMNQIAKSRAFYRTGKKGHSFEDVFGEPVALAKKRRHHSA